MRLTTQKKFLGRRACRPGVYQGSDGGEEAGHRVLGTVLELLLDLGKRAGPHTLAHPHAPPPVLLDPDAALGADYALPNKGCQTIHHGRASVGASTPRRSLMYPSIHSTRRGRMSVRPRTRRGSCGRRGRRWHAVYREQTTRHPPLCPPSPNRKLSSGGAPVSHRSQKRIMPRRLLERLVRRPGAGRTTLVWPPRATPRTAAATPRTPPRMPRPRAAG